MYRRAVLGLGYLPQETSIFRGLTVEQNIACVLELAEPDAEKRASELEGCWKNSASRGCVPALDGAFGRRAAARGNRARAGGAALDHAGRAFAGIDRCRSPTFAIWSRISSGAASAC
jgi:lipopolysaccharide export system ATP-binding protein